ncbi:MULTISPECIES: hypothetical protein [unclassified Acinetobacter]|uniref:hypothetical protein n=1 Tax=unclassified Acinetobacter TaxID=196816 RepID=UPI001C217DF6|nr:MULTISPECIES: hypothetical protein [unclassified Acinetobacter]
MKRFLIGLRTEKIDIQTLSLFLYYKNANIDVVLVVDELKKDVDCGVFPKVSINKSTLTELGLYVELENLGWLCGDFGLYLMTLEYPNYEGYWLIEDDAFVFSENLLFYLEQPLLKKLDLCAKSFWEAHNGWPWKESAEQYFNISIAKKMLFSMVYVSKLFCLDALKKRIEYVEIYSKNNLPEFLNDESFLANFSQNYTTLRMDELYSKDDLENFNFTTNGNLYFISPNFVNIKQGFYHPIIISTNSQDCNDRMIHILKKQKKLGRYYKNLLVNKINGNLKKTISGFQPRVLVCVVYKGSSNIHDLVKLIKKRWADCIILNLLKSEISFESVDSLKVETIESGLNMIEKAYPNYDGVWVIDEKCQIVLDTNQSLVKQLEVPERKKINFGYIEVGTSINSIFAYYINFDYFEKNGFITNTATNLDCFYEKSFLSLIND